jgi:hypothetical protein
LWEVVATSRDRVPSQLVKAVLNVEVSVAGDGSAIARTPLSSVIEIGHLDDSYASTTNCSGANPLPT